MTDWTASVIDDLNHWMFQDGKDEMDASGFVESYVDKLHEHGIPLDRLFIGSEVLHPQVKAVAWKYVRANENDCGRHESWSLSQENFALIKQKYPNEPFIILDNYTSDPHLRYRRGDPHLTEGTVRDLLEKEDYTDIFVLATYQRRKKDLSCSWATRNPGGFTDEHVEILHKTKQVFFLVLSTFCKSIITETLLNVYLGADPGSRVHNGSILRGDAVTVRSVIWFSDIRGFTALSSRVERHVVIDLINHVFELTHLAIREHGGEILKFMGDGILAVFTEPDRPSRRESVMQARNRPAEPLDDDESDRAFGSSALICQSARCAAVKFQEKLQAWRAQRRRDGKPEAEVGIGLHYGDCSYGNVGAPARLDFTVIGPSVNLASRVETLCSKLGATILASEAFVSRDLVDQEDHWKRRGNFALKGINGETTVYEHIASISGAASSVQSK